MVSLCSEIFPWCRLQNPNREMGAGEEEQTDEGAVPAYVVPMPVAPANLVPETLAALARPLPKTPETPEAPGLAEVIGIPDAVAMQPEMAAPGRLGFNLSN